MSGRVDEQITPILIANIEAALDQAGVHHCALVESPPAFNLHLDDGHHVFVKLPRFGIDPTRLLAEEHGAAHAHERGLAVSEHLMTTEVLDHHYEPRIATVWRRVECVPPPEFAVQLERLVDIVLEIFDHPPPDSCVTWSLDSQLAEIENDLAGATDATAQMVLTVAREQASVIRQHLDPAHYVWLHGDPHTNNALWLRDGSPVLVDWEEHSYGPREWDLAQVSRSVERFGWQMPTGERRRLHLDLLSRLATDPGVNIRLVEAFELFRAAEASAYAIACDNNPDWLNAELALLQNAYARTHRGGCMTTTRTAIIGDIGGHLDVFKAALRNVGVDPETGTIPDGLTVVQVGDLVHKGPDDLGCVALADKLARSSNRYVQLIGNHDAHYLGGPDVSGRSGVTNIGTVAAGALRQLTVDGLTRLAYAVGNTLITHAGLTRGLWLELSSPGSAEEAAKRINALLTDSLRAFRPGWLMTGEIDEAAGVTCARTGTELVEPWLRHDDMPFDQIHGHEGVWWWPTNSWHDDVPQTVRDASTLDYERRFCWVDLPNGRRLTSVDWVLGVTAPDTGYIPLQISDKGKP